MTISFEIETCTLESRTIQRNGCMRRVLLFLDGGNGTWWLFLFSRRFCTTVNLRFLRGCLDKLIWYIVPITFYARLYRRWVKKYMWSLDSNRHHGHPPKQDCFASKECKIVRLLVGNLNPVIRFSHEIRSFIAAQYSPTNHCHPRIYRSILYDTLRYDTPVCWDVHLCGNIWQTCFEAWRACTQQEYLGQLNPLGKNTYQS